MSATLKEIQGRLSERYDPDYLVELLEISSEELVEAFPDKVEAKFEDLEAELFEEGSDEQV